METFLILLVFIGGPIALVSFILIGAIDRVKHRKTLRAAAEKYLNS